jgi:hypothetical protein
VLVQEASRLRGYLSGYLGEGTFGTALTAVKRGRAMKSGDDATQASLVAALGGDEGTAEHFFPLLQMLASLEGE